MSFSESYLERVIARVVMDTLEDGDDVALVVSEDKLDRLVAATVCSSIVSMQRSILLYEKMSWNYFLIV